MNTIQTPHFYPLSSVQREIWFEQTLCPETPYYNMGSYTQITGPLNLKFFQQAIAYLVQESDVLRTVLTSQEEVPHQSFAATPENVLHILDCSKQAGPMQAAQNGMRQTMQKPFPFSGEALFLQTLYKLSDECYIWSQVYHRIVADEQSISAITQRVAELYNALLHETPLAAPQGAAYLNFVATDTAYLDSAEFERDRQFWAQKFSPLPEPLLYPRSSVVSRGEIIPSALCSWTLAPERHAKIMALAQAHSASVSHVLLALLYTYFTRVQDKDECTMGLPVANRHAPMFKQTIGLFASIVPARFDFGREIGFGALIREIAGTIHECHRHQRFPLSETNRLAELTKIGRKRLYDVSFSHEKLGDATCFEACQPVYQCALDHGFEQVPLAIRVRETAQEQALQVNFSYNLAFFDQEEIERIKRRLTRLLDDALDHPEHPICQLDILSPAERQQVLFDWNDTRAPTQESCIHQLFEQQVQTCPDAIAVVYDGKGISYAQLNRRANQVAHALIEMGVRPDMRVAICVERSLEMAVGMLGILKAGGAYVPLDPAYPSERLAHMLQDSASVALLTQAKLLGGLPPTTLPQLTLDAPDGHAHVQDCAPTVVADAAALLARQPDSNPDPAKLGLTVRNLAYVIYTSGSTGAAKGVMIEHRSSVNFWQVLSSTTHHACPPNAQVGLNASYAFDMSWKGWLQLLSGHCVHIIAQEIRADGPRMVEYLALHNIHAFDSTPSQLEAILDAGLFEHPSYHPTSILLGGEAVQPSLWRRLQQADHVQVFNMYGPTECTVDATQGLVLKKDSKPHIGKPLANMRTYILDAAGQPVPPGVAGELHVGGVGVARGYLGRPDLSAEKFIPDCFSGLAGARLYRTGDLARWLNDGNIEFLGRIDHQVKIRGFRIELGEIEAALLSHPTVRETVVIARDDAFGGQHLVAYAVTVENPPTDGTLQEQPDQPAVKPGIQQVRTRLLKHLRQSLPDYMLPSSFVFMDALPLNRNGKIDRKALPQPEAGVAPDGPTADVPRDAVEQDLMLIWESLLSARPIGIEDSFFEIGGHSLLAIRLVAAIDKRFDKKLPLGKLLEFPTISGIAALLRKDGKMAEPSCLVKIRPQGSRPPLFFLPGAGGMPGYLYPLSRCLDKDIPFFSFQAQGLEGDAEPHPSIDVMAAHYVDLMLEVQPNGPYFLAGHSLGALTAFAMAQILLKQGRQVGLLMPVDSPAPELDEISQVPDDTTLLLFAAQLLAAIFVPHFTLHPEKIIQLPIEDQVAYVATRLEEVGVLPDGSGSAYLSRLLKIYKIQMQMSGLFSMESALPMPITLIRATQGIGNPPDQPAMIDDMGWASHAGQAVPVHYVTANHLTIVLPPNVRDLALALDLAMTNGCPPL
jgi:amino acid adenylation domain-containing protein